MPLDPTILQAVLEGATYEDEPAAASAWATAIIDYFKGATAIIPAAVDALYDLVLFELDGPTPLNPPDPEIDPDPPLVDGMAKDGAGAAALEAGFKVVWDAMVAAPIAFFLTATAVTAAPATVESAILGTVAANVALPVDTPKAIEASSTAAAVAVSVAIHLVNLGGTWVPPSGPAVPIL